MNTIIDAVQHLQSNVEFPALLKGTVFLLCSMDETSSFSVASPLLNVPHLDSAANEPDVSILQ